MKKTIQYVRGFTLIELLVVIAIIGILSSVILVSLNSARSKGVATRIQEDAANLRTSFETNYNGTNYPDLYAGATAPTTAGLLDNGTALSPNSLQLVADATSTEGGKVQIWDSCGTATACTSATVITAYEIVVAFPAGGGYCVDSTGTTKTLTSATALTFTSASKVPTCAQNTTGVI